MAGAFTNSAPFSSSSHWFLSIQVHGDASAIDHAALKRTLESAVRRACGDVAARMWSVDVVLWDAVRATAVLRCAAAHVVGVRAALTLHSERRIDVLQCEPTLALIAP